MLWEGLVINICAVAAGECFTGTAHVSTEGIAASS